MKKIRNHNSKQKQGIAKDTHMKTKTETKYKNAQTQSQTRISYNQKNEAENQNKTRCTQKCTDKPYNKNEL